MGRNRLSIGPFRVLSQMEGIYQAIVGNIHALRTCQDEVLPVLIRHVAVQPLIAVAHHPAPAHILYVIIVSERGGPQIQHLRIGACRRAFVGSIIRRLSGNIGIPGGSHFCRTVPTA